MSREMTGITAPCPVCHCMIMAPSIPTASIIEYSEPSRFSEAGVTERLPNATPVTTQLPRKGRIMADLLVDQKHLEWKETTSLVRLFMYAILAISLCVLIGWLLDGWNAKS